VARQPKSLTREQLQGRKDKAVRFVRDVIGDPERAEEIRSESLEDYAARRRIQIENLTRRWTMPRKTIDDYKEELRDLQAEITDLEEENEGLQDQLDQIADVISPSVEEEEEDDGDGDEEDESR
jgi:predicted RNase H-like nuclease (RuvC/YqgF family)